MPTFQFKIQLEDLDNPPVWRRLLVPAEITFHMFHEVIQVAFGWDDDHFYMFSPKGYGSTPSIAITGDGDMDGDETELSEIFTRARQTFTYIYDFGDDWVHEITLEKITNDTITSPSCLAGEGACPPEDCGGPWGYLSLLEKLADVDNEEHEGIKEWLGMDEDDEWDAAAFDLEAVNANLGEFSF